MTTGAFVLNVSLRLLSIEFDEQVDECGGSADWRDLLTYVLTLPWLIRCCWLRLFLDILLRAIFSQHVSTLTICKRVPVERRARSADPSESKVYNLLLLLPVIASRRMRVDRLAEFVAPEQIDQRHMHLCAGRPPCRYIVIVLHAESEWTANGASRRIENITCWLNILNIRYLHGLQTIVCEP